MKAGTAAANRNDEEVLTREMATSAKRPREGGLMLDPVSVLSLATAVPPHVLDQQEVARRMMAAFGGCFERNPQLCDIFVNAGIERRYSARPIE
jgi:hypothetical protein